VQLVPKGQMTRATTLVDDHLVVFANNINVEFLAKNEKNKAKLK
jgi:hypothetical protein